MAGRGPTLPNGLPLALISGALALGILFAADPQQHERPANSARPASDYYGEQVHILDYDRQGELAQRINSPSIQHLTSDDLLHLTQPSGQLLRPGQPDWTLRADTGRLDEKGAMLWLEGNVEAARKDGSTRLQTATLRVEPQRKYAETDDAVIISAPQGRTESQGMRAFLDRDTVELKSRVKGRYEAH